MRDPLVKRKNVAKKSEAPRYEDVIEDGIDDKRLFIRYPELREVFDFMHRPGNTLSSTLRTAFDGDLIMNAGKTNPCKVREHHISFVGHITPHELRSTVQMGELSNGLVNRFLWVCTRSDRDIPNPVSLDSATLNDLAGPFGLALKWANEEREYHRDDGAEAVWRALYPALKHRPDNLMGAITERARAHVMRLALIYAVLDRDTAIRVPHLLPAFAFWQYCETSAMRIFAPIVGDVDPAAKIYRYLAGKGADGATRTDINGECFQRNALAEMIGEALGRLETMGAVRCTAGGSSPKGGRPSERYFAQSKDKGSYFVYSCDSVGLIDYVGTAKRVVESLAEPESVRINEITTVPAQSDDDISPGAFDEWESAIPESVRINEITASPESHQEHASVPVDDGVWGEADDEWLSSVLETVRINEITPDLPDAPNEYPPIDDYYWESKYQESVRINEITPLPARLVDENASDATLDRVPAIRETVRINEITACLDESAYIDISPPDECWGICDDEWWASVGETLRTNEITSIDADLDIEAVFGTGRDWGIVV